MAVDASFPSTRKARQQATQEVLRGLFADQQFDVLIAGKALGKHWDDRLASRIFDVNLATATAIGDRVAKALSGDFNPTLMHPWLLLNAQFAAVGINDATRQSLKAAEDHDARSAVFDLLLASATQYATSMVTTAANFGAHDAARNSGAGTKTWIWSRRGPRHENLGGETVAVSEQFSNGLAWPGDPNGGDASEVANCSCSVEFN
jgi:hypothetical protein